MRINHGYFGFKALPCELNTTSSIYAIANETLSEVDIIPLTIGCFNDLYTKMKQFVPFGSKIRIFPMSIQYDYISDIYNAVTTLKRLHSMNNFDVDVMWVYPDEPPYYSEEFETMHSKLSAYHNEYDVNIKINFEQSGQKGLYDIRILTPDFAKYFSQYMTYEKIEMCDLMGYEIHMNGNESRHGGLCGIDISASIPDNKKIRYFNIMNKDSLAYIRSKGQLGYDYERWADIV